MAEGQTATNPKTGEKVILRNGQWVPLNQGTQSAGPTVTTLVPGGGKPKTRILTPEEMSQYPQLDPNTLYQISPEGTITVVGGQTRSQLKPLPATVLQALSGNTATVKNIEEAMKLFDPANKGKDAAIARDAVGFGTGMLGDYFTQWNNPEGTDARAKVGQVGGLIIKDTSGAAVSISEDERLKKWVPYVTDSPEVVKAKLSNLAREVRLRNETITQTFNEDQGYRPFNLNYGDAPPPQTGTSGAPGTPPPATTPPPAPQDPAGQYPGGIEFNDQHGDKIQSYRFTPAQENALKTTLLDPNATPDDYAQMVASFGAAQGVNVDQAYYQAAQAEGARIKAALAKGGKLADGVNYKDADQAARARAEAEAARVSAVDGKPDLGTIANQGATWGLSDEASGVGKVIGSALKGDFNIADNYTVGRDAERVRLEQARQNTGGVGTAVEIGSGMMTGGAGVLANPVRAATAGGAISGFGYGEGAGGSVASTLGGAVIGNLGGRLASSLGNGAAAKAPSGSAQAVANAEKFGIDLPMGAAGGRGAAIGDTLLSNQLGSASTMQTAREKLLGQVEGAVDNIANNAGRAQGNRGIGVALQRGVKLANERGEAQMSALYDSIPIAPETMSETSNAVQYLKGLTEKFGSNSEFAKNKVNAAIVRDYQALRSKFVQVPDGDKMDAIGRPIMKTVEVPQGLSFNDLKKWRTDVGEYVGEALFTGEKGTRSEMRGLYAALSSDMEALATKEGPKALAAFKRANMFAQRHYDRLENAFGEIIGDAFDKSPEAAATKLRSMVMDGAGTADIAKVAKIRGALTKSEWGDVQAGLVRMLGQPLKAEGREFSAKTFFDTYSRFTPRAKNILFGSKGTLREDLDQFNGVMDRLASRDSLRNSSMTAVNSLGNSAVGSTVAAGIGGMIGGVPGALLGALTGAAVQQGGSYKLAKLWVNPKFVKWATGYARMIEAASKTGQVISHPKQMDLLSKVARAEPAIAADILGLQRALSERFGNLGSQAPMKAAAEDPNTRN